jgi:hypothetical protein
MARLAHSLNVNMSDLLPQGAVTCQHGPEEREILDIVSRLPMEDRIALVRMAHMIYWEHCDVGRNITNSTHGMFPQCRQTRPCHRRSADDIALSSIRVYFRDIAHTGL